MSEQQTLDDAARALWRALCEGDGTHSEALDRAIIAAHLKRYAELGEPTPPATPQPKCAHCGEPATCRGSYDGAPEAYACDSCCGHGNEDGQCSSINVSPATPQQETHDRINVVAHEIAKELFSNSFGDKGDRLAIRLGKQDFGGWSLDGAARQIRITLEQEGYVLDRMAEATRRAQLALSPPPDVERLQQRWDTRDAALRALVEQLGTIWNDERNCNAARADMALWCRNELSRLLEHEP